MKPNNTKKLSYRAEVDGLRAIAIISVILYHAQIVLFGNDWFEGGYIGVDIFFVISGYLITRIILSEFYEKGSFSFLNFYERRARRILPMLCLVIFVSFPFAWQKLLPADVVEYAQSVLASLFFGSNFFFYFSTTEYGADSALLKPFLHTWSLGIEEQFYLVFPCIALIAFKFFRRYFLGILVLFSLLSLLFSEIMSVGNPDLNFYLPFSRFWELAVGSTLAYRELNHRSEPYSFWTRLLPIIGLSLIIYSILFFDSKTPHPSFHTTVPILGVALIISFASENDLIGKILGSKPFVQIGLISYSAYLWHFPIFAFSRLGVSAHTNYDKLEWIILTVVLSILSYHVIERPFRSKKFARLSLAILGFSLSLIVASAIYIVKIDGMPTQVRLGFNPGIIKSIQPTYLFGDAGCEDGKTYTYNETEFCVLGKGDKPDFDFILVGDSHAMHSQPLLEKLSVEMGLQGLFGGNSGCPALLGVYPVRGVPHPNDSSKKCFGFNLNAYDLVKKTGIKTVFLISRWDYYVDGANLGTLNNITDISLEVGDINQTRSIYDESVARTVELYSKVGIRVVVMLQVPHQKINVKRIIEDILSASSLEKRRKVFEQSKEVFLSKAEHINRQLIANKAWLEQEELNNGENLVLIDPTEEFCDNGLCAIFDQNAAFYTDSDHPSEYGFNRLEIKFRKVMTGNVGGL